MQFVARRYLIVSLSDLITHLESDSPETVFAVTFDDGYRDNYQNAFGILQRYGVPTTVFSDYGLSRFGRAALDFRTAFRGSKATSREYIKFEIDRAQHFGETLQPTLH